MKIFTSKELKNISLLGSAGSGKTSLAEAMLLEGGQINRLGSIAEKTCISDYHAVEHDYGNSVFSTVMHTEWLGKKINFIDTPGMDDFCEGVISSINIMDTAIILINAKHGIEVGTELITRRTEEKQIPQVFVINQMDNENADYQKCIESCKDYHGNKIKIIQYPYKTGNNFNSLIDIIKMKLYKWPKEGGKPTTHKIPKEEIERANNYHNDLIEAAAENDEVLFNTYIKQGHLSEEQMIKGLKKGILNRDIFPVLCLSATKNMGVRRLMEFIGNMLPFTSEVPPTICTNDKQVICDPQAPTSLFIFKTSIEPHVGEMNYFKIVSGTLNEGDEFLNTNTNTKEKLSQIYIVSGRNRKKTTQLQAGDIGATVKLKNTKNNHTLNSKACDYKYKKIEYPTPKYRTAIKTLREEDEEKLSEALHKMHEEDPSLTYEYSKELKQLIIYGQGEFHIKTAQWRLQHNDNILIEFETPKIEYRETITKMSQSHYRHKKQSGGSGQFAEVHMIIEPYCEDMGDPYKYMVNGKEIKVNLKSTEELELPWGGKLVVCNCIVGGVIDTRYIPAIQKGVMEKMESGPLTGSYARDVRIVIYDGRMHQVDSNEISFRLASRHAFSEAFKNAEPVILEPIYNLEIIASPENIGDIMTDLQTRRAIINGIETYKNFQKIKTQIPLKETYKYSTVLSSLSGGRASFSMKYYKHKKMSNQIQEKLLEEYQEKELVV